MSSRPQPRGSQKGSAGQRTRDASRPRDNPDLNRPLPDLPSSLPDSYDIPALRRKPAPESSSAAVKHSRSISHPFPSFFGGKKVDKRSTDKQGTIGSDISGGDSEDGISMGNRKETTSRNVSLPTNNDRQPMTGKCMTCDSTVRWPRGLKVFRCTTCLTVNDLEPFLDPPAPDVGGRSPAVQRPMPISIDRTKRMVDQCLTDYLKRQLEPNDPASRGTELKQDFLTQSDEDLSETFTARRQEDDHGDLFRSRPRSSQKARRPSDPRLAPLRRRATEEKLFIGPVANPPSTSGASPRRGRLDQPVLNSSFQPRLAPETQPNDVFRSVESYVSSCCVGCTAFNISFFPIKPDRAGEETLPTRGPRRPTQAEPVATPQHEPEGFLSELDAKTLLLGDIGENGSWWTGRASGHDNFQIEQARERSPERWRGIVSAKTPRINWIELAEWYRVVIYAGDDWRSRWEAMRPAASSPLLPKWQSTSLERLKREISDSQIHLQRSLLKATENLLKRPRRPLKNPEDCRFLLMLLANPLLQNQSSSAGKLSASRSVRQASAPPNAPSSPPKSSPSTSRRAGALGHHSGIIKRILGLLANVTNDIHQFFVSWFSRFSDSHVQGLVDTVGTFVTYRLTRQINRSVNEPVDPTAGLIPSFTDSGIRHASQLHAALDVGSSSSLAKKADGKPKLGLYSEDWQVKAAARVMALLFQANTGHAARKRDTSVSREQRLHSVGLNAKHQAHVHGQIVPINTFYNSMLDQADLVADFEAWETTKSKFTFCQYPFFLSIGAKIHILEHDARRQMENKAREAFFDSILSRKTVSQYLVLKVRRDCLVEDSLKSVSQVIGAGGNDIKKSLRIDFAGEEGIDAGGLRKEWFLLLVREVFNPDHGLFVYDEESQYCYFNPYCFESSEQFFLVGVLFGLAIYNSTILDVALPPFVFKKMLANAPPTGDKLMSTPKITHHYSLEDLAELHPSLARGLRQLLGFEGDVQATFCRDFVAQMDRYGEKVEVPLRSGGEKRPVTNSNRKEFVDLYVQYLLDTAVARQYEPFKRGFFTVCGGNALSLFRPEEIELLVRGSEEPLDINSLRAVATYDGWPKGQMPERQPQPTWFWELFEQAEPIDQRKLLSFITGSDRIPAMGATNLVIRLHLLSDKEADERGIETQRFPIARTCFNQLSLYQYHRRETLEHKLWTAVTGSEGFGLK